jgi:S-(hydroxymethyl)glutathione dehydrogenase/alcohol dehydrogenase
MCLLGTFSPYTVVPAASVVKVDDDIPLRVASLVGCGVTTGFGSATNRAGVRPGDTVVVMGIGGVGANAVQGARVAGAQHIVALDPVPFKREKAEELGATHVAADFDEAWATVSELTRGQLADSCIITTDIAEAAYVRQALAMVGKRGTVVVTSVAHPEETKADMSLFELTMYEKEVKGALFGSSNAQVEIPRILNLYRQGQVKLDELVTTTYSLKDINQGYEDMRNGRNIRGMITYE